MESENVLFSKSLLMVAIVAKWFEAVNSLIFKPALR